MDDRYLFKAKRIDNAEWVQGNILLDIEKNKPYETYRIYPIDHVDICRVVDETTICQCTGLKDRNGKLIWENDIIKDNVIYGVVRWEGVNARYIIDDRDDGYQDYSEWWQECEVIGNIFDNPELLEGGE